jgi:type I restriction enzyme R subunit
VDLIEKLEKLIDAYNAATADVEETFEKLKALIRSLDAEQGRAAQEGLTEDELTIYDLLTRPEPKLTKAQDVEVKKVVGMTWDRGAHRALSGSARRETRSLPIG